MSQAIGSVPPALPQAINVLVEGCTQRLLDCGSPKAQTMVLLHSLGLDHGLWSFVAARLQNRFRVIVPDLVGHGRDRGDAPMISIASAADNVAALLLQLDVPQATIVGLSMGGAVAQEFALRHPGQTKALGLVATMTKGVPAFTERAEIAEQEGLATQITLTLERWFTRRQIDEDHEGVCYARKILNDLDVLSWASAWRALAAHDTVDRLTAISVPTLCVAGELDSSTPPQLLKTIADRIPQARFEIVAGAPHLLSLTHSCEVASLLTTIGSAAW